MQHVNIKLLLQLLINPCSLTPAGTVSAPVGFVHPKQSVQNSGPQMSLRDKIVCENSSFFLPSCIYCSICSRISKLMYHLHSASIAEQ